MTKATLPSYVFFDLDGTLIDTAKDIANAANYTLKHYGHPEKSPEEIKTFIGGGVKALLEQVMGDDHRPGLHVFRQYYWEHIADESKPYPGVIDLLESLKQKSIPMYVWTNKLEGLSKRLLSVLHMEKYFVEVIGGDVARKPEIEALIKRFPKTLPQNAVMVGDSVLDMQAGKTSGFKTCAFLNGFGSRENLLNFKPDFSFENFQELHKNLIPS